MYYVYLLRSRQIFRYLKKGKLSGSKQGKWRFTDEDARKFLTRGKKISEKEYAEFLRPLFQEAEPLAYASCVNPSRVLYVDSEFDEFIPKSGRDGLWRALNAPERITFRHGHKMSFLSLTPAWLFSLDKRTLEFFRKKL